MYGIPKFIPLSIMTIPKARIHTGTIFLNAFFTEGLIHLPAIIIPAIIGRVPNPKKNINKDPFQTAPVANAEINAI